MTDSYTCNKVSVLDCIIEMMKFGLPLDERAVIEKSRPVLETVENAFQFFLNDKSSQHSPIFYLPRVVPNFENILANYIIIRFGVFNGEYKRDITKEHMHPEEIPGNTSPDFKEFQKNFTYYNAKGKEVTRKFGDARRKFNAIAYTLLESENGSSYFPFSNSNVLVCDRSLLPQKRSSFLSRYIYEGFQIYKPFNVVTDKDVDLLKQRTKSALKEDFVSKANPRHGNLFIMYVNSPRYRSFNSSEVLSKLSQLGYTVENLFVFKISDKTYSLRTLVEEKNHFNNIYNGASRSGEDFICYSVSNAVQNTAGLCYSEERVSIECGEDYDKYFPEVASLLEGFDRRQRVLCNIIASCATQKCEAIFYKYLQTIDNEFEQENSISIFEYIRLIWSNSIIPAINEFCSDDDTFALVLEASTPDGIKAEIQTLFPDKKIVFRTPSDLIPKKGIIPATENKIVVLRFLQCKSYPSSYPNSYDPYIVNPGQQLLEFIPEILFKGLISRSEGNRMKHYNQVLDSNFRREVFHWTPGKYSGGIVAPQSYNIFGDEEGFDENDTSSSGADKVCLEMADGSVSFPIDTEPVIYRLSDKTLHVGKLRELVDNPEITGIQFLSELERKLEGLLDEKRESSAVDSAVRDALSSVYPGFDFSKGEIWKLALKAKIESVGFDSVVKDLSPKLDEKSLEYRLKDWSNPASKTMLPRKKRTRRVVFDYIGVSSFHSYLNTLYSRYLKTIRDSRTTNALIDDILSITVGKEITEAYYKKVSRQHEEAMNLFDISSVGDLEAIKTIIEERISIKNIKSISTNDE